jgi:hypothetical protein
MSDQRAIAATVVIADFTAMPFRDRSSLRGLAQLMQAGRTVRVNLGAKEAEGPARPGHGRIIRTARDGQHG